MSLLQLTRIQVGEVGVKPGSVKMIDTGSLATITAAGYLNGIGNQLHEVQLSPDDVIECLYSFNVSTGTGTLGWFQPNFSNGVITLNIWENPGNVLLPVVDGDFAVFNGTAGQIKDAGYLPTNAAKTKVVMLDAAPTINHIAKFTAADGTIGDGGVLGTAAAKAASDNTKANVASVSAATVTGNLANFADTSGTVADQGVAFKSVAGAAAAGGAAAQSFTDAFCTSASCVVGNWNTQANDASVLKIVPGNGSFVVTSSADAGVGTFNYIITK